MFVEDETEHDGCVPDVDTQTEEQTQYRDLIYKPAVISLEFNTSSNKPGGIHSSIQTKKERKK
jgi:hypothetical protein